MSFGSNCYIIKFWRDDCLQIIRNFFDRGYLTKCDQNYLRLQIVLFHHCICMSDKCTSRSVRYEKWRHCILEQSLCILHYFEVHVLFVNSTFRGTWPPIRISRLHRNIEYWLHHVWKFNSQLNWSLRASNRVFGNWCALQSSSYVESCARHTIKIFDINDYGSSVVGEFTFLGRIKLLLFIRRSI